MRRTLATVVVSAVLGLVALTPASASTDLGPVEAETMRVLAGRSTVFPDAAASAGWGRVLVTNGTTSTVLRTGTAADRLLLRLRGDQAGGAPQAVVAVDGKQVGVLQVAARTWTEYAVAGRWAAGPHDVVVRYTNDTRTATADRNLRLDRVRFAAAPVLDDAYEARVVQLVNAARTAAGLRPLVVSPCLDRYAEAWGAHLAVVQTLVHRTDLRALLLTCAGTSVAENIAYGPVTPDELVRMWLDSPGHRAHVLGDFTQIGTGVSRTADGTVWASQDFLL